MKLILLLIITYVRVVSPGEFVIQMPERSSEKNGLYKLDYFFPKGSPPLKTTIAAKDINDIIHFSHALPATRYEFTLYFSNSTVKDLPIWHGFIYTPPDPPTNLTVTIRGGKTAQINWDPPTAGEYSGFKMKILSLSEAVPITNIPLVGSASLYILKDLTPGSSYQIQLFTIYDNKESAAYVSKNFTTKPSTPGKFIVWFRNETTLLILWQPSYPAGIFSHYKVSIDPPNAPESVLYVKREDDPPGSAQAAFKGLTPGRAYNISVQTVSEDEISVPTTAQYQTIPLKPLSLTYIKASLTSHSVRIMWKPPEEQCEFDKYQISTYVRCQTNATTIPITKSRDEPTICDLNDNLEPGHTYQILVKTFSAKVASWPATLNITLKPLPVLDLNSYINPISGGWNVKWRVDNSSYQESFKISYLEAESLNGDSNAMMIEKEEYELDSLLPGRNYSITVQAVSNQIESNSMTIYQATQPSSPIIKELKSTEFGLSISWKSDVNSRQKNYIVIISRNDSSIEPITTYTTDSNLILTKLYPGARYHFKIIAVSHSLQSEPHDFFQAIYPRPLNNLTVKKVTNNSVVVLWQEPIDTIFSEYSIRYRTEEKEKWIKLPSVKDTTEAEILDLTPGEKYFIQINTASYGVESIHPLQMNHTVRPNPVLNLVPFIDSASITLEFPRPEGRIEYYVIFWNALADVDDQMQMKNVSDIGKNDKNVRILVEELIPGIKYQFQIQTISYGLGSDITRLAARTVPLILSEIMIVNHQQSTNLMTLRYTSTPSASSHFDHYKFMLSDPNVPIKYKLANDTVSKVTFDNLVPGRLYNITVWTVADEVFSQPLQRQDRLYPEPISGINANFISDRSIHLIWDKPKGEYEVFDVQYLNAEDLLIQNWTPYTYIVLTGLKPFYNYTFTIVVRSGTILSILRNSFPVSASFVTEESVPGKVEKFFPVDILPIEITFEWSLPISKRNGIIRNFIITYNLEGSAQMFSKEFKPWEGKGMIKNNLTPGETYIFKIRAETRIGYGPDTEWTQKMPILAPPHPSSQVMPTKVRKGKNMIQVRFRKNYFSDQNGPIKSYTMIVAEDNNKNVPEIEMPSWRDVQTYSVWPPYQVMEPYNPFKNSTVEDFTIGEGICEGVKGYCNGPLKRGTTYRVKIRAFTAPDKFTDTYYSFPIQTNRDNTLLINGIGILLIFIMILLSILYSLKKAHLFKKKTDSRNDKISLPKNIMEISRPVRLDNFAEHYCIMSADSYFHFSEEFEELKPVGRDQPNTAAELPCNRPKNRFTNILPYDHSRFKLQPVDDEDGSDYINANYVPGYNSPREFIVTQGPLHCTRDDFWCMCWESNSPAIVMLTRVIEKGREKCDYYWPYDTLPVYYGDISVTLLNDTRHPNWVISEFIICRGDQQRIIRHFHFTTWPDFGIPNSPQTLIRFVRAFRERIGPDLRPIVVHCSAGVGRSGTFISLDRILQSMKHSDEVDIFGIVYAMRKERVSMVQTEQQYICIHQCLLTVLQGQENQAATQEIYHNQGYEDDEGIAGSNI